MDNKQEGVADEFIVERTQTSFLKGIDFDGEGKTLEVVKMDKFIPNDPKYGVKNEYGAGGIITKEHWFIKNGILKEGESFKYTFKDGDTIKTFDNSSLSFYFSFTKAELKEGDIVSIKRDNSNDKRPEWFIIKK